MISAFRHGRYRSLLLLPITISGDSVTVDGVGAGGQNMGAEGTGVVAVVGAGGRAIDVIVLARSENSRPLLSSNFSKTCP